MKKLLLFLLLSLLPFLILPILSMEAPKTCLSIEEESIDGKGVEFMEILGDEAEHLEGLCEDDENLTLKEIQSDPRFQQTAPEVGTYAYEGVLVKKNKICISRSEYTPQGTRVLFRSKNGVISKGKRKSVV